MLSLEEPPLFSALQVYVPSWSAVIHVRRNTVPFSPFSGLLFLDQSISGLGEPSLMMQVMLTFSPSRTACCGPDSWISGGTKNVKV